jgi:L-ascorbate metabolism protein UlaG (beta-lactamase superfamily)
VVVTGRAKSSNPYYRGPRSDHFDGTRFFNPDGHKPRNLRDLLKWQLGGGRARWPHAFQSPFPHAHPETAVAEGMLRATMVGHASLLIQAPGLNILTDPVWSRRVSPLSFIGPQRVNEPGIAFADLPKVDIVLVSHNHYDHLDLATLARLRQAHDPLVVTPLGNDVIIRVAVPEMRIEVGDWGDTIRTAAATIHIEPVHHWSARGTRDRLMALWCGFAVETRSGKLYVAGDTGFHGGRNYSAAAARHGGFRFAVLPIGAYEPRWFMEAQHQNPEEAVEGMLLCKAEFAAGCHWGTFHLTNEPVAEPRDRLLAALDARGVARARFRPMLPGEVWDIPAFHANHVG